MNSVEILWSFHETRGVVPLNYLEMTSFFIL